MKKHKIGIIVVVSAVLTCTAGILISKERVFTVIDPYSISRYTEDRIVFQRIETVSDIDVNDFTTKEKPLRDNSIENLMIIKNSKIHFLSDGFDEIGDVQKNKFLNNSLKQFLSDDELWPNKINGKPDYIRILYRRNEIMINTNEEFVTTNFGTFYKAVRDKFIKLHIEKFRQLLRNKNEAGFKIEKRLLSFRTDPNNHHNVIQKYFLSAKAKAQDGTVYYCEDADGDGITETFTADRNDGFDWGIDTGPNILFILGNTDKDIETLIGKLVNESIHGTAEEEKKMFQQFPTENEVMDLMNQLTPLDKFYE